MKRTILFLVLLTLVVLPLHPAQAQSTPSCTFEPDGSISCKISDGGDDGGGGDDGTCTPGKHLDYLVLSYDDQNGTGQAWGEGGL